MLTAKAKEDATVYSIALDELKKAVEVEPFNTRLAIKAANLAGQLGETKAAIALLRGAASALEAGIKLGSRITGIAPHDAADLAGSVGLALATLAPRDEAEYANRLLAHAVANGSVCKILRLPSCSHHAALLPCRRMSDCILQKCE
eukprot:SAG31_NODE_21724_length_542_cov_1.126411_1_plen_146_part_00